MQSRLPYQHSHTTINNYFINNKITVRKNRELPALPQNKGQTKKKRRGYKLTVEKIVKQYDKYLKTYDALDRKKLNSKEFQIVCRLTWLFSRVYAYYNPLSFETRSREMNISCAFQTLDNEACVLLDISGNKDKRYRILINKFVDQIQRDKNNILVQDLYQFLNENNLSLSLVREVSYDNRKLIYIGPKYCSEKSLYIELEKRHQRTGIDMKVVNFSVVVVKYKGEWNVISLHPQSSCKECRDDREKKEYYMVKNSKIIYDDKDNKRIICKNPHKLDTLGNLPSRELSPPRVRELKFKHYKNKMQNPTQDNLFFHPKPIIDEVLPHKKAINAMGKLVNTISIFSKLLKYHAQNKRTTLVKKTNEKPKKPVETVDEVVGALSETLRQVAKRI